MIDVGVLAAAFVTGLISSAHCVGMCGGITLALSQATKTPGIESSETPWLVLQSFQLGRILTYALLGLFIGFLSGLLDFQNTTLGFGQIIRTLALILALMIGAYQLGVLPAMAAVERIGQGLWRKLLPMMKGFIPVRKASSALLLGSLWGLLPCALVYGMLLWSLGQPNILMSSLLMLAFGLGTFPAMLLMSSVSQMPLWLKSKNYQRTAGLLLIAGALYGLWQIYGMGTHGGHG